MLHNIGTKYWCRIQCLLHSAIHVITSGATRVIITSECFARSHVSCLPVRGLLRIRIVKGMVHVDFNPKGHFVICNNNIAVHSFIL